MFRALFENAPDAMVVVDRTGHIVRANPQFQRLFDYDESDLLGETIEKLMPDNVRLAHHGHLAGYADNPRVRPMGTGQELMAQKRDGQRFPVEIALSPIQTDEGPMFLASVRDISETQRARQALRARYDACVARISQLALAAPNLDAAIASAPGRIAEALGAEAIAIVFRHPQLKHMQVRGAHGIGHDSIDALPWPLLLHAQATAASSAPAIPASLGFRCSAIIPLIDLDDEQAGALLALCRTRSAFDQDDMRFLQSVANLIAAAMQRIRIEEQLSHAQRLDAIGQLTGGVAHDFDNLLTIISGNLQILEDEVADRPAARDLIGAALRGVARGADLTRNLLAFARRQRLAPRASDSTKLLVDLGVMLHRTLGESVQLEIISPEGTAHVFADPGQLEAAIVNLALNARDAMPRGGRLTITAAQLQIDADNAVADLGPGSYVEFTVADTGMGMAPEILARAFEPFFTTKEPGRGSGLGLSMVYGFIKQSGGHMSVESELGHGTRMHLYLPAADTGAAQTEPKVSSMSRGSESIVVVEDEGDVRDIAVAFLRSAGYNVLAFEDAESALEQIASHPQVALLFSDVVLGTGMNGIELAEQAQRLRPALRVLLTSGYEHNALDSAENRAYALLRKPYRREELSGAVRAILDQG